jgi:hypothetical protein
MGLRPGVGHENGTSVLLRSGYRGSTLRGCFGDPIPALLPWSTSVSVGLEGVPWERGMWIVACEHASETSV